MKKVSFDETIKWYDKNASMYANDTHLHTPFELINEFLSLLPPKPSILDAGCGAGRDTGVFYQHGANVIGIDLSKGILNEAKKRYPKISFVEGDLLALPFSNETFDGIWAHASLVHFETIEAVKKAVNEFYRVLKPNGIIYIDVRSKIERSKGAIIEDTLSQNERFFRYFTVEEVKSLLTETDFQIISLRLNKDSHARNGIQWITSFAKKN